MTYQHSQLQPWTGHATWHTNTSAGKGNDSMYLIVQNDGNPVLHNEGEVPIWAAVSNK